MKAISKQRLIDAAPIVALLVVALILPFVLEPFWGNTLFKQGTEPAAMARGMQPA